MFEKRFHLIKMRLFHTFLLQLGSRCSNLRVAENPLFCWLNSKRRRKQGFLFSQRSSPPARICDSFQPPCAFGTEINFRKEDSTTYGKWKEDVEDAAHD